MNGHRAVAASMAVLIVTGAGCSASAPRRAAHRPASSAVAAQTSQCPPARVVHRRTLALWPSRTMLRESTVEAIANQVVDLAGGTVFLLASKTTTPVRGPWVLCRISLATGAARSGPTVPGGGLTLASGYLWAYSAPRARAQPVVSQVNPLTLERARTIRLPSVPASFGGVPVAVTAGPDDSVWIGSYQTLRRVNAATGTPLARVTLPHGLAVDNVAVDPAGATLYASPTHMVRGGIRGLVMLEYDARSGRQLAVASGGLLRDSVAGAAPTAVPGGVWISFRTGMLGLTIHLRQHGLALIAPPGPRIALTPATGLFHWAMSAATIYGGGALWLANEGGWVACLNPRNGTTRAAERIPLSRGLISPLQADGVTHHVIAVGDQGLIQVTPPKRCWH
jgi:hypothetical protein